VEGLACPRDGASHRASALSQQRGARALQESQEPALRERLLPPVRAALAALP
jgi:hypothetical protein